MRDIKIRGYSKYLESWIYGFGALEIEYKDENKSIEIVDFNGEYFFVKDESIGQYIGLKDKNGKEIYEGDIVQHERIIFPNNNPFSEWTEDELKNNCIYSEEHDDYYYTEVDILKIEYNKDYAMFEMIDIYTDECLNFKYDLEPQDIKVIGNIYENKDLLEGGN